MHLAFSNYIKNNNLCTNNDKVLIALSGGADSIALLQLMRVSNYNIGIAHCNFNLRGSESDGDESFVKELANKYNVESHFISFDTKQYAKENQLSIEMAARDLRYNWFNKLCSEHHYTKIATGHHLNDSIETLFINLTRGTGINGITGIKPIQGNIIRPLLFASREQIETYVKKEKLEYRTDSSNASNEYVRNIIRNEIIPKFKEINPSFEATMQSNMEHFKQTSELFNSEISHIKHNLIQHKNEQISISIVKLLEQKQLKTILYEIVSQYGFSLDSVHKIMDCLHGEPGKIFYSETHQLLIDRKELIIEKLNNVVEEYAINSPDDFSNLPIQINAQNFTIEQFKLNKNATVANLDEEKIAYPLKLRKWSTGDSFHPLGMKNKKKLSDFFIDQKVNRFEKDKTWILESNKGIIWIVGLRIDDRFKVTDHTQNVLQLTLQ